MLLLRALRLSSHTLSRILFKRGSVLTKAQSGEPAGTYFVAVAPKLDVVSKEASELRNPFRPDMHTGYALGRELPTTEQPRHADHCENAEFDLLQIGVARDARIT